MVKELIPLIVFLSFLLVILLSTGGFLYLFDKQDNELKSKAIDTLHDISKNEKGQEDINNERL